MLNLASETPSTWTERACGALDEILLDHAHCEKKAAGGALRLLFSYPDQVFLQRPLAEVAQEELTHFQQLLDILDARGIAFERQKPSPYAGRLHALVKPREPRRLTDLLLICALIEARSCERMKCLAEAPIDPELQTFYKDLLASEARHHQMYVELACEVEPADVVRARLQELAETEAEILAEGGPDVRIHS